MRIRTVTNLLVLSVWFCLFVQAQSLLNPPASSATPQDPLNRDTPQSSVFAFLAACRSHDYARARKYLDLRSLPEDQRLNAGTQLAQQLEQILDRDVRFDVAALSRDREGGHADALSPNLEHVDSFTVNGRKINIDLERITLRSGLSVWVFSCDSVAMIPQIARMASDSPIEKHLPDPLVSWKLIDTSLWRWIALALLAVALASLSKLIARLAVLLAEPVRKRFAPRLDARALDHFVPPLRLLLSVALFRAGMEWIGPSALLRLYLERAVALVFFLGLFRLSIAIVDLAGAHLRTRLEARRQTFSYSALPLASRVIKLTILLFMLAAVLSNWGYNTTTILAGLGVGGLAIALAAQKTVENLFGGVAVISDRPVLVGDYCRFGDRQGTVEDIGLRSTRIRTIDRTLVTVPNAQFSSMMLENFSKQDKKLFHLTLNLRRDTTPEQVRSLLESITGILKDHTEVEAGRLPVRFVGVGTYSLDLEVFAYVATQDGDEFLNIQQELLLSILQAIEAAGTALAVPTQASITYGEATVMERFAGR